MALRQLVPDQIPRKSASRRLLRQNPLRQSPLRQSPLRQSPSVSRKQTARKILIVTCQPPPPVQMKVATMLSTAKTRQ
ncbi:uncharacterized protein BKA78DRAFT_106521 [Phyllosticta capitalensis]|uniref:uncharacterized protein n=1 Tax=Phyllosticta capitalensis TaxID=121624 RepID=UPI00312EDF6F